MVIKVINSHFKTNILQKRAILKIQYGSFLKKNISSILRTLLD